MTKMWHTYILIAKSPSICKTCNKLWEENVKEKEFKEKWQRKVRKKLQKNYRKV